VPDSEEEIVSSSLFCYFRYFNKPRPQLPHLMDQTTTPRANPACPMSRRVKSKGGTGPESCAPRDKTDKGPTHVKTEDVAEMA
jgi:hypothetical protein